MRMLPSMIVTVGLVAATAASGGNFDWIDGKDLPIEGRCLSGAVESYYDRLPANLPASINGNVQVLKHHTSGEQFRFTTTSSVLFFRWSPYYDASVTALPGCAFGALGMAHMPATGVSGIDVYAQAKDGTWEHRYTGFVYPGEKGCVSTGRLDNVYIDPGTPVCVNLPLYNGLRNFQLGVLPGSKVRPLPPRRSGITKPVVFYGTSITQGGCASRPGLGFVNVIGRELDVPVVNLGFSGGGRMELAMSDELARIDASCYVLDCLANMFPAKNAGDYLKDRLVETNYEPFVRRLRKLRPGVPIVLAEQSDVKGGGPNAKDLVARAVYEKLVAEGWKNLVYLPKQEMFRGHEETVDGCHANDLGMMSLASAFGKAVATALGLPPADRRTKGRSVPMRVLELPAMPDNPRNSEGDFAVLNDGRIVYTYSHYSTAEGGDNAPAYLASRYSSDGGRTWTDKSVTTVEPGGALNVMSVSYKRLKDGALAIFYLRKNSEKDCRPVMQVTKDEGKTWGKPVDCVSDADVAYYVLNNCRVERLRSGRLLLPLWQEKGVIDGQECKDLLGCYLSDDDGRTWHRGRFAETVDETGKHVVVQEPGAVELNDGRILMYARTDRGRQWFFHSSDGGETFSKGEPGTLFGPLGPATVKRLKSGDLLAVWNDHEFAPELAKAGPSWAHGLRTPMTLAISKDGGKTWTNRRTLEGNPRGWYCYFAVLEKNDELLLGYGDGWGLGHSRLTSVPLVWLCAQSDEHSAQQGFFMD